MAFTNADKEELVKAITKKRKRYYSVTGNLKLELVEGALFRLEAAERVCNWESKYEIPDNTDIELSNLLDAWRKSKGA